MSDLQATTTLPRPIAVVLQHHGELQTAYIRQRAAARRARSLRRRHRRRAERARGRAISRASSRVRTTRATTRARAGVRPAAARRPRAELPGRPPHPRPSAPVARPRRGRRRAGAGERRRVGAGIRAGPRRTNETTAEALVSSAVRTVVEKSSVTRTAPRDAAAPSRRRSRRSGGTRPTARDGRPSSPCSTTGPTPPMTSRWPRGAKRWRSV